MQKQWCLKFSIEKWLIVVENIGREIFGHSLYNLGLNSCRLVQKKKNEMFDRVILMARQPIWDYYMPWS